MFFLIRQNISIYFIPLRYFPIHYSKVSIFIFRVFRSFPFECDYLYQYAVSISYHLSHLTRFHPSLYLSNLKCFHLYLWNVSIFTSRKCPSLPLGSFHLYRWNVSIFTSGMFPSLPLECFHLYLWTVSFFTSGMFPSLPLECFHLFL